MLIQENLTIQEKLKILADMAKYDVACTSSGVKRRGKTGSIGNTSEAGICYSLAADGRCISLLKVLFTNQCIYDCKYRVNRCTNDVMRAAFTPDEVCKLTIEFYRENYIEGPFLSFSILYNVTYTMEQIYETMYKLRNQWNFSGYTHVKAIPGAGSELMEHVGFLADRVNVNLELPTAERLKNLAPRKTRGETLNPMRQIQQGVSVSSRLLGYNGKYRKPYSTRHAGFAGGTALIGPKLAQVPLGVLEERSDSDRSVGRVPDLQPSDPSIDIITGITTDTTAGTTAGAASRNAHKSHLVLPASRCKKSTSVPAGQSTQMTVGATPENSYQMMSVTQALYRNFGLKWVFCPVYIPVNKDGNLPSLPGRPLLLGEYRLYQADWLLRFYGSKTEELLSEDKPNFNVSLDPECDWALRHLEGFPVEVNRVSYDELLHVPGMGVKSAVRIMSARGAGKLGFEDLKKLGVMLKQARYFITCSSHMMGGIRLDQDYITNCLTEDERRVAWDIEHKDCFRQLSLFNNMHMEMLVTDEDQYIAVLGSPQEVGDYDHLSV